MGRISVVGIGPGAEEYLTPAAREAIEKADVTVGGWNALSLVGKEKAGEVIDRDLARILGFIKEYIGKHSDGKIAVLTSGDPGFYSILGLILKNFPGEDIEVIPGISSMQMCFARLLDTWHDSVFISLHGRYGSRDMDKVTAAVAGHAGSSKKVVILTDGKSPPDRVARTLLDRGVAGDRKAAVCDSLSFPEERLVVADLEEISQMRFSSNCVMVISDLGQEDRVDREHREDRVDREGAGDPGVEKKWEFATPGIPDSHFVHDKTPMTKEEIRAVTLSKARIKKDSIIYDIGAGSGSVSVEAGILAENGRVYSIEKEAERLGVVRRNIRNFGLLNVIPIQGEAPDALDDLPEADRIVIGGSGGRLKDILLKCSEKLMKDGIVVINAVTLDTLNEACRVLDDTGFEFGITQVSISRARRAGKRRIMSAMNPVFIIDARRRGEMEQHPA